jgi:hypothetical protein
MTQKVGRAKKKQGRCPASKILGNPFFRLFSIDARLATLWSQVALPRLGPMNLDLLTWTIKKPARLPAMFATKRADAPFLIDVGAFVITTASRKFAAPAGD